MNNLGHKWLVIFLIVGLVAASCLPACSAQQSTLKIVISAPLQGVAGGKSVVEAIELALAEENGQIAGHSIELLKLDDGNEKGQWQADLEKANVTKAITDSAVIAYIGPLNSGAAQISIPEASRAGLLQISPGATWPGLTKVGFLPGEPAKFYPTGQRNFYRTCPTDDVQALAAVRWARELGFEGVYIIDDGEPEGKGMAYLFEQRAQAFGLKISGHETINKTATDFIVTMSNLWRWKPDVVYFSGYAPNGVVPLLKQMRTVKPSITAAFMTTNAAIDDAFLQGAGALAEGSYATLAGMPPSQLSGDGQAFVRAYTARYGHEPEAVAAYAYDAAKAVIEALKNAKTKDRTGVLQAMASLASLPPIKGAMGEFSFDQNGDTTLILFSGVQVKDGQFQFVKPLDVKQ